MEKRYSIKIFRRARRSLEKIRKNISRESLFYADKTVEKIISSINNLNLFTNRGANLSNITGLEIPHKYIMVHRYAIIYVVRNNVVKIVDIFHTAQDLSKWS